MSMNEKLQTLLDKQEIAETLMIYARAIDRKDPDLLRTIYWPDAYDDHLTYKGDTDGFLEMWSSHPIDDMPTQMLIGNVLIEMEDGENAHSEAYYQAYHDWPQEDGTRLDHIMGGRYIDHFQKREDVWKILRRTLTLDWYQELASTSDWPNGMYASITTRGADKPDDPLYRLNPLANR